MQLTGINKLIRKIWKNRFIKYILKMGCCNDCLDNGLGITYQTYIAFASDSSGSNFSLSTPLATSKYIAFLNLASTAGTPVAADFTGLWTPLYGTVVLDSGSPLTTTSTTTLTTLNTLNLAQGFWKIGDELNCEIIASCATPSLNSQAITIAFLGQSPVSIAPINFDYGGLGTVSAIKVSFNAVRTAATTISTNFKIEYIEQGTAVLLDTVTSAVINQVVTDSDGAATTLLVKGQCANGADSISLDYICVKLNRS